jgi:hypothetical protein
MLCSDKLRGLSRDGKGQALGEDKNRCRQSISADISLPRLNLRRVRQYDFLDRPDARKPFSAQKAQ